VVLLRRTRAQWRYLGEAAYGRAVAHVEFAENYASGLVSFEEVERDLGGLDVDCKAS